MKRIPLRTRSLTILDAIGDPKLFGQHFRKRKSWQSWRAFLATLFGLPLDPEQLQLFRDCTGRQEPNAEGHNEAWLVIGRRGGKSFVLATIAVFLACFKDWQRYLGPGERATVMVVATDRRQARVIMRYVVGLLHGSPLLKELIRSERAETLALSNRVTIEVHSASFRTTRGYTIVAALLDELAFWPTDDAAEPDVEVINAIKPGMATIPGAMLLCASSPYARRGALWDAYRKHHGQQGDPVLVWQAPTRVMNPSVPETTIQAAIAEDPSRYQAEYLAQFRSDIESYIAREAVEACISIGCRERAPVAGLRYHAFVDPSGGSSDSMTLAIAHRDGGDAVLDALRERRPPFSPEAVVADFAHLLKSYRITKISGDRYAGEWPRDQFRKHGITYEPAQKSKSDIYRDLLPAINSKKVDLLNDPKLINQLVSLERRTARGGRDSIDHPPDQHDDLANAAAGVITRVIQGGGYNASLDWIGTPSVDQIEEWRRLQFQAYVRSGGRIPRW
jgi:hypothetical protein